MSAVVYTHRTARVDLVNSFYYDASQGSLQSARRFLAQAEATFSRLARMPGIATIYEPDEPMYIGLRYFPISRFRDFLVFYREIPGGIEVLRILHGARDIAGILSEEFAGDGRDDVEE
ncbi:type II toxin-antitoxin system RelE/ParE family toxin [Singulisphaera rosea]